MYTFIFALLIPLNVFLGNQNLIFLNKSYGATRFQDNTLLHEMRGLFKNSKEVKAL